MKYLFYLIIISTMVSCMEYWEITNYKIINLSSKEIVIKTNINQYNIHELLIDSSYSILTGGIIEFTENRGQTSKKSIPPDYFEPQDSLPPVNKFEIYADNVLIDTLRLRQLWNLSARETMSTYTLTITDSLLDSL